MALSKLIRALSEVHDRHRRRRVKVSSKHPSTVRRAVKPIVDGGEMGQRVREFDWSKSPLGPIEDWGPTLRNSVELVLNSSFPLLLIWGPEHIQIYNDGFIPLMSAAHPAVLGQNFRKFWVNVIELLERPFLAALQGQTSLIDQHMFTERSGRMQELFLTYSYGAVRDEEGAIVGVIASALDETTKTVGNRRTKVLLDLNAAGLEAQSLDGALLRSAQCLADAAADLPCALLYRLDEDQRTARLVAHAGLAPAGVASPVCVDLLQNETGWPFSEVLATGSSVQLDDLATRFPNLVCGPYPEPLEAARVQAIFPSTDAAGRVHVGVVLITGMSTRLAMDAAHKGFHELIGTTLSHVVANALAAETRDKQVEALASIDRAKSLFFSDISHEFRTPLTLLLGPLEDELADPCGPQELRRTRLEVAHRNGLRLLKLVNNLLDFSSIDSGRARASFEPTDISALTVDLAATFRTAFEKAGLALRVDCPPVSEAVFVDHDMWEKVVFNLLSNAFKHTFQGGVEVRLRAEQDLVALEVEDSGVGIPAHELPHLFERFHRVRGTRSRTHEGSGIGLALVQDVLRLHGGTLQVSSVEGRGSCFRATLRTGSKHLPPDQIATPTHMQPDRVTHWLPAPAQLHALDSSACPADDRARILWVEDNADLREYVLRLLSPRYDVQAFENGASALAAARAERPDLVLTDIMMPELDGIELLRALRQHPVTQHVPVILLSARAGPETSIDGLDAGADDYLVKPFTARELLSRVRSHLELGRARQELTNELERKVAQRTALLETAATELRESEEKFQQLAAALDELFWIRDVATRQVLYISPAYERIWHRSRESLYNEPSSWADAIHPDDRERVARTFQQSIAACGVLSAEYRISRPDGALRWIRARVFPIRHDDGVVFRMAGVAEDITERKHAEHERQRLEWQLQQSQKLEALGTLTGGIAHDFNNLLSAILGHAELAREDLSVDQPARESVDEIHAAGQRAKELVRRLLSFSRRNEPQRTPLDLTAVLDEAVRLMRAALPASVELSFDSAPSLPLIEGDSSSIHQVALNLITNAWQALRGCVGRIEIQLASCRVDTTLQQRYPELRAGLNVRLSVSDTGCGIDAETLPRIFEPFFTTKAPGTGLGLSVVHGIVRSYDGAILVDSKLGAGTTFHVYLPASNCRAAAEPIDAAPVAVVPGRGERILFVDDEPTLVRLAIASLGRLGYRVDGYTQPAEAVAAFRSDPSRYDLVITDYNMPQLSGLEVARQVLRIDPRATIALVTGYLSSEELEHARAIGVREILLKPLSIEELGSVVRSMLVEPHAPALLGAASQTLLP